MKMRSLVFSFLLATGPGLQAQENLLYNPGFEKYKLLPDDIGQGKKCLEGWTIPVLEGGGDYFHADSKSKKAGTEKNYFGSQPPHSGKAYTGICITRNYREYLQMELEEALEKGRKYKVEVYISCGDVKWLGYMKGFGVIFSSKMMMISNNEPLLQAPAVNFMNPDGYKNTKEWEKLEAVYEADGTEKFITFGSFCYRERNENEIRTYNFEIPGAANYAHYFIDDFTLTPLTEEKRKEPPVEQKITEAEKPFIYETDVPYVFSNIVFESGKAELLSSSFDELNKLADYLSVNPQFQIKIFGHTDNVGKPGDNLALSEQRALAVKKYLEQKNISPLRMKSEGKGDSKPLFSNSSEENRALNRRVEILFY